jgi:hypothetical protein
MLNIYYITLKVSGDPIDEDDDDDDFKKTQISMEVTQITRESKGQLKFSHAVNMTNVVNRFDEIFKVYVKNTMKNIEELKDFEMTSYIDDNSTPSFNFT